MTKRAQWLVRCPGVASLALTDALSGALGVPPPPFQASPAAPAGSSAADDPGTIAYVKLSTHGIHLISPDGTGDRVLWTAPRAFFADPPYGLA